MKLHNHARSSCETKKGEGSALDTADQWQSYSVKNQNPLLFNVHLGIEVFNLVITPEHQSSDPYMNSY